MGNIDCRTIKQKDLDNPEQIKMNDKICLRMNLNYPKTVEINGDHEEVSPETKRLPTEGIINLKRIPVENNVSYAKKKKVKRSQNQLEQFMNELNADNDYSKKQMKKLSETSYSNTNKTNKMIKEKPLFKQSHQFQKMMSQQQKFIETNKIYIEQQMILRQTQQKYPKQPLSSNKYQNRASNFSSLKQSMFKLENKYLSNEVPVNDCDTIIKKQDQKIVSNTETSNLMNLIYHLEADNKSGYKSPVIMTENNEIIKLPLNDESFEIDVYIDGVPEKVMVRKGDNLNSLMHQFIEKHSLPEEIHEKLVEDILTSLQGELYSQ